MLPPPRAQRLASGARRLAGAMRRPGQRTDAPPVPRRVVWMAHIGHWSDQYGPSTPRRLPGAGCRLPGAGSGSGCGVNCPPTFWAGAVRSDSRTRSRVMAELGGGGVRCDSGSSGVRCGSGSSGSSGPAWSGSPVRSDPAGPNQARARTGHSAVSGPECPDTGPDAASDLHHPLYPD